MKPDYDRAARMAYKALLSLNVAELPIDPLKILKHCKNTCIHTYDEVMPLYDITDRFLFRLEYMEDHDAFTVRKQFGNGIIRYELFYDSHVYPLRLRFTLAHELAHIILGHNREDSIEEREADYFASQLLAPHPLLVPMTINGYNMTPDGISDVFRISKSAACVALAHPKHHSNMERDFELQQQFIQYIYEHGPNKLFSEVSSNEAS